MLVFTLDIIILITSIKDFQTGFYPISSLKYMLSIINNALNVLQWFTWRVDDVLSKKLKISIFLFGLCIQFLLKIHKKYFRLFLGMKHLLGFVKSNVSEILM